MGEGAREKGREGDGRGRGKPSVARCAGALGIYPGKGWAGAAALEGLRLLSGAA